MKHGMKAMALIYERVQWGPLEAKTLQYQSPDKYSVCVCERKREREINSPGKTMEHVNKAENIIFQQNNRNSLE